MSKNLFQRIASSILIASPTIYFIYLGGNYFKVLILIIFFISLYEILKLKILKTKFLVFIILVYFAFSCLEIISVTNGKNYLFFILLITFLSDTGGYLFGKIFGGKKINIISQNKTYIGFFGSLFVSQSAIFYTIYLKIFFFKNLIFNSILILFSSLIVIVGDLFFSYIKRKNNVKDYSNLLVGHGGLLDRIDGLIFLTIFYNLLIKLL